MKERRFLQVLVSAMIVATTAVSGRAVAGPLDGPIAVGTNGHVYQLITVPVSWTQARDAAAAASVGLLSHLVTVTTPEENALVCDLVRSVMTNSAQSTWIGLTDEDVEGDFRWITGEPLVFTNWDSGEPNDEFGAEDYGHLRPDRECRWNDLTDDAQASATPFYTIEYDLSATACADGLASTEPPDVAAVLGCAGQALEEALP